MFNDHRVRGVWLLGHNAPSSDPKHTIQRRSSESPPRRPSRRSVEERKPQQFIDCGGFFYAPNSYTANNYANDFTSH